MKYLILILLLSCTNTEPPVVPPYKPPVIDTIYITDTIHHTDTVIIHPPLPKPPTPQKVDTALQFKRIDSLRKVGFFKRGNGVYINGIDTFYLYLDSVKIQ